MPDSHADATAVLRRIVQEVATLLIADDWLQMTLEDGRRYYVIGADAWSAEVESGLTANMLAPSRESVDDIDQHFVRSQLAAGPPASEYLARGLGAAEREGVDVERAR